MTFVCVSRLPSSLRKLTGVRPSLFCRGVNKKAKPLHKRVFEPSELTNDTLQQNWKDCAEEDAFGKLIKPSQPKRFSKRPEHLVKQKKHHVKFSSEEARNKRHLEKDDERDGDWADTFGMMSLTGGNTDHNRSSIRTSDLTFLSPEGGDEEDEMYRSLAPARRYTPAHYGRRIRDLAKEGKMFEAIDVLETTMLKDDRVMPDAYVFSVLIGALGRVGYTRKAFQLYLKMKKLGIETAPPIYTGLFNACANSPWRDTEGLERAKRLWQEIQEKEISLNHTNYNAAVKAFGRCGDLLTSFAVADQMEEHLNLQEETYAALLMGCISDKEAGLRHAIEVWRRMRKRKFKPTIYHYNLLLRAIRDCGLGDLELANQLLGATSPPALNTDQRRHDAYTTAPTVTSSLPSVLPTESQPGASLVASPSLTDLFIPNILNPRGRALSDAGVELNIQELSSPEKRLKLFGGVAGVLRHMGADQVDPDVKTFALLLDLTSKKDKTAEYDLLAVMETRGVEVNTDFLNMLLRRQCNRYDREGTEEILTLMAKKSLPPNIMTFGCLATGCQTSMEGLQLLEDMKEAAIFPNLIIYRTLLFRSRDNFYYKISILKSMLENEVVPDEKFLLKLETDVQNARKMTVKKEHGQEVDPQYYHKSFTEGFTKFRLYYTRWLKAMKVEPERHPWAQYQEPSIEEEGGEEKWKAPKLTVQ